MAENWEYQIINWYDKKRQTKRRVRRLAYDECPKCGGKKKIKSQVCFDCWKKEDHSLDKTNKCWHCGKEIPPGFSPCKRYCCKECKREALSKQRK